MDIETKEEKEKVNESNASETYIEQVKWLLDTQYQSIITWLASSIAVFIGMIELLPEIRQGLSWLNGFLSFIYMFLLAWGCISIYRVLALMQERVEREQRLQSKLNLPDDLRVKFWIQKSWLRRLFVMSSNEGKFESFNWKVIYAFLVGVILVWLAVLVTKIFGL